VALLAMKTWIWLALVTLWALVVARALWRRGSAPAPAWSGWNVALGGAMAQRYAYLREVFEGNAAIVRRFLEDAAGAPADRACEVFEWGLTALAAFVPTARERLDEWHTLAAVVEAEVPGPWPAVRRNDFALPELRRLAARERWRLRLGGDAGFAPRVAFLRRGFEAAARAGAALAARVEVDDPAAVRARAQALAHDFDALCRETLTCAQVLLTALEGEEMSGEE
jgi:hypothetical protein